MARFPLIPIDQRPLSRRIRYFVALAIVGATRLRLALIPIWAGTFPSFRSFSP